jgi:hypothetical protein
MKEHGPQVPDSEKKAYYAGPVHPSLSRQSTMSSVGSKDWGIVPVQHGAAHSEVAILAKVSVVQTIQVGQKGTNVSRN